MQSEESNKPVINADHASFIYAILTISDKHAIFSATWQAKVGIILFSIGLLYRRTTSYLNHNSNLFTVFIMLPSYMLVITQTKAL
ncbi:MAG: hypothetical protein GY951_12985 [Psychromonas sp.]|nr:hypothetical protein [Psychromonas sp.]